MAARDLWIGPLTIGDLEFLLALLMLGNSPTKLHGEIQLV
jgi:hypothetical protein